LVLKLPEKPTVRTIAWAVAVHGDHTWLKKVYACQDTKKTGSTLVKMLKGSQQAGCKVQPFFVFFFSVHTLAKSTPIPHINNSSRGKRRSTL
jgi:hypothetical protein